MATVACIPPLIEDPSPSAGMLGDADELVVASPVVAGMLGNLKTVFSGLRLNVNAMLSILGSSVGLVIGSGLVV